MSADIPEKTVLDLLDALPGVDVTRVPNTTFYFYDPERNVPHDRRQPFVTVVSANDHDTVSRLDRPGVFRINIGVARETYRSMFGPPPAWNKEGGPVATGHDFAQLDVFLPHPVYAPLSWICILSPTERTWPRVQALIHEAREVAVKSRASRPRG